MLLDAFDSNWIAPVGPDLDAFEDEVADGSGSDTPWRLSSGTAALHLALLLMGWAPATTYWSPRSPSWPRPPP